MVRLIIWQEEYGTYVLSGWEKITKKDIDIHSQIVYYIEKRLDKTNQQVCYSSCYNIGGQSNERCDYRRT